MCWCIVNSGTTWKHAHGISSQYNTFTTKSPWYGAGQGLGDAAPCWVVLADSMILAYQSATTPWILTSPSQQHYIKQGFNAFVDDTDIIAAQSTKSATSPVIQVQQNLNMWHDILQASGSELNPAKCVWFYFDWRFNSNGWPSINKLAPTTGPQMTVQLKTHLPKTIWRLKSEKHIDI